MESYDYLGFTISEDETPTFTTGGRLAKSQRFIASGNLGLLDGSYKNDFFQDVRDLLASVKKA